MSIIMPWPRSAGIDVSDKGEFPSDFLERIADKWNEAHILISQKG